MPEAFSQNQNLPPVSLRSSLAMGSVIPLTLAVMDALPSSPPREVWVMGLNSCWTFSRMNMRQSGEKQVRGRPFTRQIMDICHTDWNTWIPQSLMFKRKILLSVRIQWWSTFSQWFHFLFFLLSCRWDLIRSRGQSSDSQSGRAILHWSARVRSGTWIPDIRFLPGTKGTKCYLCILWIIVFLY